jgi:hypothetical protein
MFCTKCGATVDNSAQVCPSCGNVFKQPQDNENTRQITLSQGSAANQPRKVFSNIWIVVLKVVVWLNFFVILAGGTYILGSVLRSSVVGFLASIVVATLFVAFPMVFLNMASDINEINYHLRNMDK